MHHLILRPVLQKLTMLAVAVAVGASATGRSVGSVNDVTLVKPYEIMPANNPPRAMRSKLESLAEIDPDHPPGPDSDTQTLSLFGREDLIAVVSDDYKPTGCAPTVPAANVMDEIVRRARQTSVVIINESHERSLHRQFTAEVARQLRPLGYDTLALETLSNPEPGAPTKYLPPFLAHPELPYLQDNDGHYLSEASYGRLGRHAKALGYRLLPYEDNMHNGSKRAVSQKQQIVDREETQASNLAAFLQTHPTAKVLVHVGYSHAAEAPLNDGRKWMAARLREKTGIDPLTISQTTCRGGGDTRRLASLPSDQPAGAFDLVVDHPTERFTRGRPTWRTTAGDRVISIPAALRPTKGWRVIEARPLGEPTTSVPVDRVAIRPGENIALMLPPGQYRLNVIDVPRSHGDRSSAR